MEGTYRKLIENSRELITLGHLSYYFTNSFRKRFSKAVLFLLKKIAQVMLQAENLTLGGLLALSTVLNGVLSSDVQIGVLLINLGWDPTVLRCIPCHLTEVKYERFTFGHAEIYVGGIVLREVGQMCLSAAIKLQTREVEEVRLRGGMLLDGHSWESEYCAE